MKIGKVASKDYIFINSNVSVLNAFETNFNVFFNNKK